MEQFLEKFERREVKARERQLKLIDNLRERVLKDQEDSRRYMTELKTDLKKMCNFEEEEHKDNNEWFPKEIDFPRQFFIDFIASDRQDFLNKFLTEKFGTHFRADRHGSQWERRGNKYFRVKYDIFEEWAPSLEHDYNLCMTNPTTYRNIEKDKLFFKRLDKMLLAGQHYLERDNFDKFLVSVHKKLGSLR